MSITLRGIIYPEDGVWLAHCLEMDIVAEGTTPEKAFQDLVDLCNWQLEVAKKQGDVESAFRPAPPEYWKLFFVAQKKLPVKKSFKTANSIDGFEARELQLV
jgi:hypothetical protein